MHISVVIPTYNRAHLLVDSIPLLMGQATPPDVSFDVTFVNNGSRDDTEVVLARAAAEHIGKIRYLSIAPSGGPAAPRNSGIRFAGGDIVVLLDDDVLPDSDLVQRHAEYHRKFPDRESAAIGVAYVPDDMLCEPVSLFHEFDYGELSEGSLLSYRYFWTANLSIKRQFMLDSGMFDERFLYNEDLICGHQLSARGLQLRFWPSARGMHRPQMQLKDAPAKGKFVGRWIWATSETLPDPEILFQYGVLSLRLGPARFIRRLINRAAFPLIDNALARAALRFAGAESGTRSKLSDLYYYVGYRKCVLSGYREARRAAKRMRRTGLSPKPCEIVRSLGS